MKDGQTIIAEVGATIASRLALNEVMSTIARQVGEAFNASSADIHKYSPEVDRLDYVASWGAQEGFTKEAAGVGESYSPDIRPSFVPVVRERRLVEVHRDDPDLPAIEAAEMDRWGEKTLLNAPLEFGGQVIGVLGLVASDSPRRFTAREKKLFSQLAVLAAIAIHNADVFGMLAQQNRSLQSLLQASQALASTVKIDETLKVMSQSAAAALEAPGCVIYELLERDKALVLRSAFGTAADSAATGELPLAARPGDQRALERRDVVVESAADTSLPDDVRSAMRAAGESTHLHVPLIFDGRPLGTLVLVETAPERTFSAHELDLVRSLAQHAAAALNNARSYEAMQVQANTDGLTGLHNFRYLQTRVHEEAARFLRYGTPLSLLILDVDDFKLFNDDFGHPAGDEALKVLAGILRENVREDIDIVCRYGGDEFAVLLPNTVSESETRGDAGPVAESGTTNPTRGAQRQQATAAGAETVRVHGAWAIAERIREAVESGSRAAGRSELPRAITVSVGIAQISEQMPAPEQLVVAADKALYVAKQLGRNRVERYAGPAPGS